MTCPRLTTFSNVRFLQLICRINHQKNNQIMLQALLFAKNFFHLVKVRKKILTLECHYAIKKAFLITISMAFSVTVSERLHI